MKPLSIFKQVRPLWIAAILCLPLIGGCQKSELDKGETLQLDKILENTSYPSMPLVGTKWKLIGFVDEKKNEVKLARPSVSDGFGIDSFTLLFEEDGKFSGYTSTNTADGRYSAENDLLSIYDFRSITKAGEMFDGYRYIESIDKVFSFDISTKGLILHYETRKYLLFEPVE